MDFTKDDTVQMLELTDSELNDVAGAGGFGACGSCGVSGFGFAPFVSAFAVNNAVNFAVGVNVSVNVGVANQVAFANQFY